MLGAAAEEGGSDFLRCPLYQTQLTGCAAMMAAAGAKYRGRGVLEPLSKGAKCAISVLINVFLRLLLEALLI